jgi:acyl-CoA oxidase
MGEDIPSRRIAQISRHLHGSSSFAQSSKAKVMQELQDERKKASFPTRAMTFFLDDGEDKTKLKEEAMAFLTKIKELKVDAGIYDLTHDQKRIHTLNRVRRIFQIYLENGTNITRRNALIEIFGTYDLTYHVRNGVHFGLYMGALMSLGDPEQQNEWLSPAIILQHYGCFAMTELGHGSFVKGLETTANYDKENDEFLINTPTDTATKWWIGAAGETATHCVCYAQLIIDGKNEGVQTFVVQLRDLETHEPLPGIHIGDIGLKMGLNGVDNGWIQFQNVRVPRFNMLRRYAHVTKEGKFVQTHKPQMAYAALIGTRGSLIMISINMMKKALVIAIRYCAIRRQGVQVNSSDKHPETKLLDYQSHQYRLMPLIAKAYAYHLQLTYIQSLIEKFDLKGGNLSDAILADVHGTMAGMKAFTTWDTLSSIEECREACGGQGFSSYSGLAHMLSDFSVMVTFEGDNTVMALQTASYVVRSVKQMQQGKKLSGSVEYLERKNSSSTWKLKSLQDLRHDNAEAIPVLRDLIEFYARTQALRAAEMIEKARNTAKTMEEAWNSCHIELIETARIHVFYNVADQFLKTLSALERTLSIDTKILQVLKSLCILYITYEVDKNVGIYLREKFITAEQSELIKKVVAKFCKDVRSNAVPLVDSFNLSDAVLNSSIGRQDGNIYESLLNIVKDRQRPSPYFQTHIKPMLESKMLDDEC